MTYQTLTQGIEAVQAGHIQEGARMIRLALKSAELTPQQRAVAYIWLAHTVDNPNSKINYYNEAIQHDPQNSYAREGIAYYMANTTPNLPETPPTRATGTQQIVNPAPEPPIRADPQSMPAPVDYNNFPQGNTPQTVTQPSFGAQPRPTGTGALYRTVGILGASGKGTGFFITRNGLIATTRANVGGSASVNYEITGGQRGTGQVVRSWAEYDLALIHTGLSIQQLLPMSNAPTLPENTPITAIAHGGRVVNGVRRATKSQHIPPEWFPTDIRTLPDTGGNPVFNPQNLLVGMLTQNANRSAPYFFGLHISTIFQLMERYAQEIHNNPQSVYCPSCGNVCRSASSGGFYCEFCGAVLPHAERQDRFNLPQLAGLYGENLQRACPNCNSTVGFYKGVCLRCGHELKK